MPMATTSVNASPEAPLTRLHRTARAKSRTRSSVSWASSIVHMGRPSSLAATRGAHFSLQWDSSPRPGTWRRASPPHGKLRDVYQQIDGMNCDLLPRIVEVDAARLGGALRHSGPRRRGARAGVHGRRPHLCDGVVHRCCVPLVLGCEGCRAALGRMGGCCQQQC